MTQRQWHHRYSKRCGKRQGVGTGGEMPHLVLCSPEGGRSVWQPEAAASDWLQSWSWSSAGEEGLVYNVIIADTCYVPKCFPCLLTQANLTLKLSSHFYRWKNWGLDSVTCARGRCSVSNTHGWIFIYFACLGLCCCTQVFSSCREQGLLFSCGAWACHCGGFSCPGHRLYWRLGFQ